MITLAQHIDELRAELRGCPVPSERADITAELEAAIAALQAQDGNADRPPG